MEGNGANVEKMAKRSNSFPSSAHVTTEGGRTRLDVEFLEKLGRNDPCLAVVERNSKIVT